MLARQRLGHWTLTWLVRRLVTNSPQWRFSTSPPLPTAAAEMAECRAKRELGDLERETGLEPATFSLEG